MPSITFTLRPRNLDYRSGVKRLRRRGVQVTRAMKRQITQEAGALGSQVALCTREPEWFRDNLLAHVAVMGPLGFNAHALGVLVSRNPKRILTPPKALVARYTMLRGVFGPAADELARGTLSRTGITPACLPAVAHDAPAAANLASASGSPISCLHKAILAGPKAVREWSPEGLEAHLRKLVAAGLFDSEAEARRGCMRRWNKLLASHTLEWVLQRRAAVLAAGGSADDVRAVCSQGTSLPVVRGGLLLWKRARCGPLVSMAAFASRHETRASSQHFRSLCIFEVCPLCRLLQSEKYHACPANPVTTQEVVLSRYLIKPHQRRQRCAGFAEYLTTADGQAELQKLQARAEKQAREELQAHPSELQ